MSAAPQLSVEQLAAARDTRERFLEHLQPGGLAFIEDLVRDGLIRGWRDIAWVGTAREGEERDARLFKPRALNVAQWRRLDDLINWKIRGEA